MNRWSNPCKAGVILAAAAAAFLGLLAPGARAQDRSATVTVPVTIDTTRMKLPASGPVVLWTDKDTGCKVIGQVVRGEMLAEGHPMIHIRRSGMHY